MSFPLWREYIILELDPVASVAWIDDPEVTKACQSIKTKKYVGCISDLLDIVPVPRPDALLPVYVALLSRGMVAGPEPFMLPEMSMPVGDETPHPLDRKPIKPDPPLPWSNCYHPTLATACLCIRYEVEDKRERGKYIVPSSSQTCRFSRQNEIDFWWKADLEKEQNPPEAEPGPTASPLAVQPETASPEGPVINHVMPNDDVCFDWASTEDDVDDNLDNWSTYTMSVYSNGNNFFKSPVINFSVDLETLPAEEISNPFDFLAEIAQVKRIVEDHQARVKAKIEEAELLNATLDAKAEALRLDISNSKTKQKGVVSRMCRLVRRIVWGR